jgi:hypothetical protein
MVMNNELQRIGMKAISRMREWMKNLRISSLMAEIYAKHLPDTSLEHYCHVSPFSIDITNDFFNTYGKFSIHPL